MKKTLILIVLIIIALLVVRDVTSATKMAMDISAQEKAISMYETRHGPLETTEQRHGYLDNAYQACAYLDDNPSLPDLWTAMTDSGISSDAAVTVIEAAITYLCTEHSALLT